MSRDVTAPRIAIASCASLPDWEVDDAPLVARLADRGACTETIPWDDPGADWSAFDACLIRTTWDYADRRDAFVAWATRVEQATKLFNPASIVTWNTHKSYLRELETAGVPVIDTVWVPAGTTIDLDEVLAERAWDRGFIKPAVGCSAQGTCRFDRSGLAMATRHLETLLASNDVLLQPYLDRVESTGEASAIVIDGVVTHCVRKRPRPGDYRVQDDYGATDERFDPGGAFIDLARRAVACANGDLLYARADFLQNDAGAWQLTELEAVEPSLFFRHAPEAAERLAEALLARV